MKLGLVGVGKFSDDFVRLFNIHPDIDEVVLADLDQDRIKTSMEKHGIKRAFNSYEEMLDKVPELDAVAIFTQRHLHGPMIIEALKRGKHVYSAVPIGCTIEETKEIVRLVKETRLIYMMGETCYYYPCAIYCREKYKSGDMGKFVYGESQYYHDICEMYDDFARSGGENWQRVAGIPPMFYPTHSISMIFSAINEYATKVSCMGLRDNYPDNIYGEDKNNWNNPFSNETALFQMSGGGIVRINEFRRVGINKPSSYITCFYGDKGAYECSVTKQTFQKGVASGEKPYIEDLGHLINTIEYNEDLKAGKIDMEHDPISVKYIEGFAAIQDRSRLPKTMRNTPKFSHYNSHPFLVDDFVRAVMSGKLPPNNAWESARFMIPGLIAHESALRGGELMDIPDMGEPPAAWERLTYEMKDNYEDMSRYYEIAAVCDINEAAAKETAQRHGISRYYTDAKEMIEKEKPDVVSVCVPNCFHKEYTIMALESGANVLCEKPLAFCYKDAEEMFECAEKNGKVLMTCQSMRFTPDRLAAKEYIVKNGLDDIYYGELSRIRRCGIPFLGTFHIKRISCGGAFVDIGVHMLDALVWLMGNPKVKSVNAATMQNHKEEIGSLKSSGALTGKVDIARKFNPDEMDVEDFSCGSITFENGARVSFKVAWAANMPESSDIRLVGKKQGIFLPECKVYYGEDNEETLDARTIPYDTPFSGHMYIVDNLRAVLKGEAEMIIKPEETLNVSKIIELFYKSAELSREVFADEN